MLNLNAHVIAHGTHGSIEGRVIGRTEVGPLLYLIDIGHGARPFWVGADALEEVEPVALAA